jgi:predicted CXXCH cytochrome family protein
VKIRHLIDETSANGTRDSRSIDFDQSELVVGRGSGCDLRLDSRLVSLNHARITAGAEELSIEDLDSLGGVQVNGQLIKRATLRAGDTFRLGDITLTVERDGGVWVLRQRIEGAPKVETEVLIEQSVQALQLQNRLPSFAFISAVLMIVATAVFFVYPWVTTAKGAWNSGPISNNHHMIADNCGACHMGGFSRVADSACESCHNVTAHAKVFEKHLQVGEFRCADCHMEHNGDNGLVARQPKLCTSCHANIKAVFPETTRPDVVSWDDHPEFMVSLQAKPGEVQPRVRLDDTARLIDRSNIKLNHAVHLQPNLRGKDGDVTLTCRDCHGMGANFRQIEKISMEKHCASCHSLEFDERLPGTVVPHGDPDTVYRFLYSEYAKLYLASKEDVAIQETFSIRAKPGGRAESVQAKPTVDEDFVRGFVEGESRKAERMLFTKTACFLCHEVSKRDVSEDQLREEASSQYEILKPQIPEIWMPESIFSHGAHEEVSCESCHAGARTSEKTSDVLLPRVDSCRECHSSLGDSHPRGGHSTVKSDCIMCHSYHDSLLMSLDKKHSIEDIVSRPVR